MMDLQAIDRALQVQYGTHTTKRFDTHWNWKLAVTGPRRQSGEGWRTLRASSAHRVLPHNEDQHQSEGGLPMSIPSTQGDYDIVSVAEQPKSFSRTPVPDYCLQSRVSVLAVRAIRD